MSLHQLLSKRYVVVLLAAGGLLIAISTVVRYQFGAAAQASFSGDALGVFYGQFALVLNLASIAFTLFVSRALVEKLGAARSLLVYPGAVGAIAAVGALLPGLVATIAAQFAERLFRQNVHNSSTVIVGMPSGAAATSYVPAGRCSASGGMAREVDIERASGYRLSASGRIGAARASIPGSSSGAGRCRR